MLKKYTFHIILIILMFGTFTYRIYENYSNNKLLLNSKTALAKIIKITNGAVRNPATGTFEFYIDGSRFEFYEEGNFTFMQIGDTVLIKYAILDPSVATVANKFHMQKYQHLK